MGQGVFDFFAGAGLGISGLLFGGINKNFVWLWMVLAAVGLLWAIIMSASDEDGIVLVLKQILCVIISSVCVFGYLRIDLAPYSYIAAGKLESALGRTQGGAMLPTYAVFRFGRAMMVDGRDLLAKGQTTSIPNVVIQADLLSTDEEVLDDKQLKANLAIWNQIVAPYILKQDPEIEEALGQAGLLPIFMTPIPSSGEYMGYNGQQAAKVQEILATSKIGVAEMLCTLQSYIEATSSQFGGATWTSENGTCIDPAIRIRVASTPKSPASIPKFFNRPPQAAWDQGRALIAAMITESGVDSQLQTITSLGQLYEKIGQSGLYIAANNYASDSDKVIVLGTACDKMSTTNEPNACAVTQSSLASAMGGVSASAGQAVQPQKKGFWDNVTGGIAFAGAWLFTSVFRIIMAAFSAMTSTVIPYAIGIGILCSLLLSAIGPFILLWPKRFTTAMEWMIGPVSFVCLWGLLHNIWTELDTWIMLLVGQIGSIISEDRLMGKNVAGIICSLGYLGMPFLSYTILFGSVGNAIAKTTGIAGTSVKMGALISVALARMAAQIAKPGGGGGGGGGPGAGSAAPGSGGSPPPSSSPASSAGGSSSPPRKSSPPAQSANSGGSSPPPSPAGNPSQGSGGGSAPPGATSPSSAASSPPSSAPAPSGGYGGSMPSGQSGYGASVPASPPPAAARFQPLP